MIDWKADSLFCVCVCVFVLEVRLCLCTFLLLLISTAFPFYFCFIPANKRIALFSILSHEYELHNNFPTVPWNT